MRLVESTAMHMLHDVQLLGRGQCVPVNNTVSVSDYTVLPIAWAVLRKSAI